MPGLNNCCSMLADLGRYEDGVADVEADIDDRLGSGVCPEGLASKKAFECLRELPAVVVLGGVVCVCALPCVCVCVCVRLLLNRRVTVADAVVLSHCCVVCDDAGDMGVLFELDCCS
jgi:hypothetical protein